MNTIPKDRTVEQHNAFTAAQARVLTALSDHAPNGRLRFTVDLAKGTVEVEDQPQPKEPTP